MTETAYPFIDKSSYNTTCMICEAYVNAIDDYFTFRRCFEYCNRIAGHFSNHHWIGLVHDDASSPWRWIDGTPFTTYPIWQYPPGSGQNCAVYWYRDMLALHCGANTHFICKAKVTGIIYRYHLILF